MSGSSRAPWLRRRQLPAKRTTELAAVRSARGRQYPLRFWNYEDKLEGEIGGMKRLEQAGSPWFGCSPRGKKVTNVLANGKARVMNRGFFNRIFVKASLSTGQKPSKMLFYTEFGLIKEPAISSEPSHWLKH